MYVIANFIGNIKHFFMKNSGLYFLLFALVLGTIQACGPSKEERRAAEQARLDSLRQVEQTRIADLEKAREDSIRKAEEEQRMREEEEANTIRFAENGEYAVQVGAWRSEEKANRFKEMWSDREYDHVYVVQIGDSASGDVWNRVRIGFFDSKEEAEKLGSQLSDEINSGFWVSKVTRTSR